MNREQWTNFFKELQEKELAIMQAKNHDYSSDSDPFANFREFGELGFLVRLCFSNDTEILTDSGWKLFKDLSKNDLVATLKDNKLLFDKPLEIYNYDYYGKMYNFKTKSVDWMVTPEHNLYIAPRHCNFRMVKPNEALKLRQFKVKIGCDWDGNDIKFIFRGNKYNPRTKKYNSKDNEIILNSGDFCEFLGIWLAEGCTRVGTVVRIAQTNEDNKQYIFNLLNKLKLNPKISGKEIYFSNKSICQYLNKFGNRSYNKMVIKEIKDLNKNLLKRFLLGFIFGDGWIGGGRHNTLCASTSSGLLANDLMEIGLKCGFAPKINKRKSGIMISQDSHKEYKTIGNYNIIFSTLIEPNCRKDSCYFDGYIDYNGKVYCCTVQSGVILVRRNGKPFWSGNSDKTSRVKQYLQNGTLNVNNESIIDTLMDASNYCNLLIGYLKDKDEKKPVVKYSI